MAATQRVEARVGISTIGVHFLPAKEDNFGGIVVDVLSLSPTDAPTFVDSLHLSLELWRSQVV